MHQFDSYLNSILNDLNISKKQKDEVAEEFKDHLERLKQAHIDKGHTEDEAVMKAIEDFGNSKELSKRLNHSLLNYRTKLNILFGIGYILFAITFYKISHSFRPLYYGDLRKPFEFIRFQSIAVVLDIIRLSPISYFLPIIFMKVRKLSHLVLINILIIIFTSTLSLIIQGIELSVLNSNTFVIVVTFISMLVIALFSSILGYKILNIVNNRILKYEEFEIK